MNNNMFTITGLAQVDTTKPVLKSISVDKTAVTAGQSVGITVEAADEEGGSGIKSVDVYYSSPVTSKTKSIRLAQNADGKYIGQLAMTENDESGTWIIQRVVITDNTGNYNAIYNSKNKGTLTSWNQQDFSDCNFELSGTVVDTVKPELKSISINKTSVTAGQSVEVTVDAADEEGGSGIASVVVYYSSPVTSKTKSIRLAQNADGKYIGQLTMTENDESGTWIIQRVVITDHTVNYNAIYNSKNKGTLTSWNQQDFSYCNFELSGTIVDTVKPELTSISINKTSVTAGQNVEITVDAADDENGSGIASVVIYYSSPVTYKTKSVRLAQSAEGGYMAQLTMTEDDELGTWLIQRIVITDHTGNYNAIYNSKNKETLTSWNQQDFSHCNFEFGEAAADPVLPEIETIHVDKKEATAGDIVNVKLTTTNDEGVKYIYLYYKTPQTNKSLNVTMRYNQETKSFEGNIPITSQSEPGQYSLYRITMYDTTGNPIDIQGSELFENGYFIVNGTNGTDLIEGLTSDKKEAVVGDTVNLSLKSTEGEAEIDEIVLYYKTPETSKSLNVNMTYDGDSGLYKGSIPIQNYLKSGDYSIYRVIIYCASKNTVSFDGAEYEDLLQNGNFLIKETTGSQIFESITVDAKDATVGDTVKISMKVPEEEGIRYILLWYTSPVTQKTIYVNLYYNFESDSFEGSLPITTDLELGKYTLNRLGVYFQSGNIYDLNNYVANGDFSVFAEGNPPIFKSVSVEKNEVEPGDYLNFYVEAVDDTNLQEASIVYTSPESKTNHSFPLEYDSGNKRFSGGFDISESTEIGKWTVNYIEIKDTNQNSLVVNAGERDLSSGEFMVHPPVAPLGSYNVKTDESWSSRTINSDVYIVPDATLTIENNVTINGNVYVLGGLKSYGGLSITGTLYANSIYFGYYSPANGQAILAGSNNISRLTATNRIINEVPLTLYDLPLVSHNGKVDISGATLPFVMLELNGNIIKLKDNGTFRLDDFDIGDSEALNIKITGSSGFVYLQTYDVSEIYVDDFSKYSQLITGRTQPDALVKIISDQNLAASGKTDEKGFFEIPVSHLVENSQLKFEVYNSQNELVASKEITVKDITAPVMPIVNMVTDQDRAVKGQSEAGAVIEVRASEDVISSAMVDAEGNFSAAIPVQLAGSELTITATDKAGNVSEPKKVIVKDITAPAKPMVEEITDKDTSITGQAEAGSKVEVKVENTVIGTVIAGVDANFTIPIPMQKAGNIIEFTAQDKAGNVSPITQVEVKDKTAPSAPKLNSVTDFDKQITGSAEPGATVLAKVSGKEIGRSEADASGQFSIDIEKQPAGSTIEVIAIDKAGNAGASAKVTVTDEKPQIQKLVGKTRYTTAVEISQAGWDKSETVFLVNGWAIADGLTATPLASAKDAPILLTTKNSLPEETLAEIERLKAKNIVLIGGSGVISDQIKSNLLSKGHTVTRIGGKTRYDTSLLIAQELDKLVDVHTVYMAYGHGEPDALSIAAQSGQAKQPIILTERNAVPAKTYSWLKGEGLDTSYFIGGKGVISPVILDEVNKITSKNVLNNRLSGINRQETNAKVIEAFYMQSELPTIMVAHSHTAKLVDALAAGPLAAKYNVPVLLVSNQLDPSQLNAMAGKRANAVHQIGGGIDQSVLNDLVNLLN
ncbi:Ig-like domain-containing protein [Bacillus sp. CMF12]|uniref:Ig-like domain-containing protein n=1 Tax=Bacillus sp. CMF12 TaxID=2884834 RepID=UPI002079FA17|nr:Ig-like domain-containing protein [Bacillus sp. CMF12]USK49608.1 Ig-like domain-containing protein [Bacillus sp. CMF12]